MEEPQICEESELFGFLFDEEALEEARFIEALSQHPIYQYVGDGDVTPGFADVAVKEGLIFAEPELGDLLVVPNGVSQELRCPICKDVLCSPHFTVPCGHVFCESCITDFIGSGHRDCPVCRAQLFQISTTVRARAFDNLLSGIRTYCQNGVAYSERDKAWIKAEGPSACPQILSLPDAPGHFATCLFKLIKCPFHVEGCADVTQRQHLAAHRATCHFRTIRCVCGQQVRVTATEAHEQVCPASIVDCPHRHVGCPSRIRRFDSNAHLRTCPYEALKGLLAEKDAMIAAKDAEIDALLREVLKLRLDAMAVDGFSELTAGNGKSFSILFNHENARGA